MIKPYTFKLNLSIPQEKAIAEAIESWQENGHSVKSAVCEVFAKYHGLEAPRPTGEAFIFRELRRLEALIIASDQRISAMAQIMHEDMLERQKPKEDTVSGFLSDLKNSL